MDILKSIFGGVKDARPEPRQMQNVPVVVAVKTEEQIIAEIHASFDSAQDELLRQAEKILAENVIPESQRTKAENLRRLGFVNTTDVQKLNEIDRATDESRRLAHDIIYYKQKYPFLKFLTTGELDKICTKYGLVHSDVGNYKGDVPDKNLQEIQDAQPLDVADYPYSGRPAVFTNTKTRKSKSFHYTWDIYVDDPKIIDEVSDKQDWRYDIDRNKGSYSHPAAMMSLSIAAPKAMFHMTDRMVQVGNELVVKDPIVFRHVRGGIQVLSKWGLEASDSSLIIPINN